MFGEIVICQFPFTSGIGFKIRPALVLFELPRDAVICRITSVLHHGPADVSLRKAEGLLMPSVARLDRLITAEESIFLRRLGVLSASDLAEVRQRWNKIMKL
jgi:mRNA-degrading endonuclease toxin of MazEF toxin-antitoxin module